MGNCFYICNVVVVYNKVLFCILEKEVGVLLAYAYNSRTPNLFAITVFVANKSMISIVSSVSEIDWSTTNSANLLTKKLGSREYKRNLL